MSKRLVVEFVDTLMWWTGEFHVQSGDRQSFFYFRVPDEWVSGEDSDLQGRVFAVAQEIYEDLNAHFRAADPGDLGYLLVKGTKAQELTRVEESVAPWLRAENPAVWEWTPCVVVEEDGSYARVARQDF